MMKTALTAVVSIALTLGLVGTVGAFAPKQAPSKLPKTKSKSKPVKPVKPSASSKGPTGQVVGMVKRIGTNKHGEITNVLVKRVVSGGYEDVKLLGCGAKLSNMPQLYLERAHRVYRGSAVYYVEHHFEVTGGCIQSVQAREKVGTPALP